MTDFDPIKATREEITELANVQKVIQMLARDAERKLAEAEAGHTALAKVNGFMRIMLESAHAKLRALEDEAERKAKGGPT